MSFGYHNNQLHFPPDSHLLINSHRPSLFPRCKQQRHSSQASRNWLSRTRQDRSKATLHHLRCLRATACGFTVFKN